MAFTIPNVGTAAFTAQAMANATDFDIIVGGTARSGVSSGCAVSPTGAANGAVAVASGTAVVDAILVAVTAGNVTIAANSSGNPRRDLITVNNTGTKGVVVGTAGAVPLMPAIPAGRTVLADVYVPNGHGGASTIAANQITDKRLTIASSDFQAHNVLEYGAVGDSNHTSAGGTDDTLAIQAAYDAAQATGGFGVVVFPAGRTYRITDTIETLPDVSKQSTWTWGVGSRGSVHGVMLPNIVWDGAAGGTMFNVESSGPNTQSALFRNVRFAGRDIANTAIRFFPTSTNAAKLDTGTGLDEVHMGAFAGNGIQCDGAGATNFWIRGGRWDRIAGYPLYMRLASQTFLSIRDVTWDLNTPVSPGGQGFVHFDATGGGSTARVMCHFDSVHVESGTATMAETDAAGETAADKRGIIACTIDPSSPFLQFYITMTNFQILGKNSSTTSHSLVQMLGGTTTERRRRLSFSARNVTGLNGDGTASLGHFIPIGGIPAVDKSPYTGNAYMEINFGPGGISSNETPRVWSNITE